ncbi:SpvB/TcaC N-terminal domain-containing protein [Streptomyces sp. NPDC002928]|uniref:SpvB/TcaC N-terminal domain-containing protein n=1 Tax=Streptomyces sp. NPDC002928 TaxID=3154440 RepID=UPI0033A1E0F6
MVTGVEPEESPPTVGTVAPARHSAGATADFPNSPSAPVISLPKGGGAIRGIGEKFTANPATGTGGLSIPLAVSPGRSGFAPSLTLGYDSAAGNGPFGIGWGLGLPAITRKTDKGIPRYAHDVEDTFVLTGAEDLVPVLEERAGDWGRHRRSRTVNGTGYVVHRYRPRVEGLYARIERWTHAQSGATHWRSISRDNVTTVYGRDAESRIADPADAHRVFSWLICESTDGLGNVVRYEYKPEDDSGIDLDAGHERNRTRASRATNRYLKRIRYGNSVSRLVAEDSDCHFEVVFDYGEHDESSAEARPWNCRLDPFSSYRAGFEVRCYRLCRRVLMFHHFPAEPEVGHDCLVRSTDLAYRDDTERGAATGAFLASVAHSGMRRRESGGYLAKSLPPVEFTYSEAGIGTDVRVLDATSTENAPIGVDGSAYRWTDLEGDGMAGLLTEQAGTWFYKPNLGGGRLGPMRRVRRRPTGGRTELLDLDGDGRPAVVDFAGPTPGYTERADGLTEPSDQDWKPFRPFRSRPDLAWDDPNLRFVDLSGDGRADVLVTGEPGWTWYRSLGEEGFDTGGRTWPAPDEESGPRLVFSDRTSSIHLADLSGDGLADLVRVRNAEICYWPNLGHGRFGAKVTMDGAPLLDNPDQFDPARIRLADVDGSGPTDLIYLHRDGVRLHRNLSGNAWSPPRTLPVGFPRIDNAARVDVVDLLGSGTGCLVWSSALPSDAGRPLRYVDLMKGGKPHLLTGVRNNLGAETHIRYAPSTRFQAEDAAAGRPWLTRLPFVVHVVDRVETVDAIGRNRFVSRYAYHHGYFDGREREFRGFGMVEQTDTEVFDALTEAANVDEATYQPPSLTRTWFHTGAFLAGQRISRHFEHEYFDDDLRLPDTVLPDTVRRTGREPTAWTLSADEERQACRALKGSVLRTEVYALDGGSAECLPFQVTERNYTLELLQPAAERADSAGTRDAVFALHPRETLTGHYERTDDPRITHELVLAVDDFGNPLRTADVAYGRRTIGAGPDPEEAAPQRRTHIVLTEHELTNPIDGPDDHRAPMPAELRSHEVRGLGPVGRRFEITELDRRIDTELPYQDWDSHGAVPTRRLIEHSRTLFRRDDLSGPLALGTLEPMALPYETYRLAWTPGLIDDLYGDGVDEVMLREAGYPRRDGGWWIPSGRVFYSVTDTDELEYARAHFFQPLRFTDPLGETTTVSYDDHDLLVTQTVDPLGNRHTVGERGPGNEILSNGHDYRVLQPRLATDPNGNRTMVSFDVLGRVAGTATTGRRGEELGDSLDGFDPDPDGAAYFADPLGAAHDLLGEAGTRILYDESAYLRSGGPCVSALLSRETHRHDLEPGQRTRAQHALGYTDGFGRLVQKKIQAEPGPDGAPRWVGTGWTVYDNKGNPVRTYEPFFTAHHDFEFARAAGVGAVRFYDPLQRVVATLHPDHTYAKTVVHPWYQRVWDANDTVLLDPREDPDVAARIRPFLARQPDWASWYARRVRGDLGPAEQRAAERAARHAGTPTVDHLDALGRAFLTVTHNRSPRDGSLVDEEYSTVSRLDIEGNIREVRDALGRVVIRYGYTMLGERVTRSGMDAGPSALFPDVLGKPRFTWTSRGFTFRFTYDPGHRLLASYVTGPGTGGELLYQRTEYGENAPEAVERNLRGQVFRRYDGAGISTNERYDFRGNQIEATRRFACEYRNPLDWNHDVPTEDEVFTGRTRYDALNRPILLTTADGSVVRPCYNEANLLEHLDVVLPGEPDPQTLVVGIDYNARGQRTVMSRGNGVRTEYEYDPATFRPTRLRTRSATVTLQDLQHVYDPVGNIVSIRDTAQQTLFFRNRTVEPDADYTYDAMYRLIEATGREHPGQGGASAGPHDAPRIAVGHPDDGTVMSRYRQRYLYDEVGNLLRLEHRSADPGTPGWTRAYTYGERSLLEPEHRSNRLTATTTPTTQGTPEPFAYDAQGNITSMPGLPLMAWDPEDRLGATARRPSGDAASETTYYVYDVTGQRVRKVTECPGGRRVERRYVGAFEVHREQAGDGRVTLERQTLHILDGSERIALVERRTQGQDDGAERLIRHQVANHLGSAVLELDDQARVITREEYYPYGGTAYQAVRSQVQSPKRFRFTGKERDRENGLYYHGARYYAPWLGRWTSCDPTGMPDGPNPYLYVRANPVNLYDAKGAAAGKWWNRAVGVVQVVGGALEIGVGAAGVAAPTGVTQVLGVVAIAHGADTTWAGLKTVWTGEVQKTYTEQAATAGAKGLGASDRTAERIGMGVDLAAGVIPSAGIGLAKAAMAKALTEGGTQLAAHAAPEAAAHVAPGTAAHAAPDVAAHAAPDVAAHATPDLAAHAAPEAAAQVASEGAAHAAPTVAAHTAPSVAAHAAPTAASKATAEAAEAALRVRIVDSLERTVARQVNVVKNAISHRNVAFLQRLGMSPKQINILLNRAGSRPFSAIFGQAMERAVERAVRSNPLLSKFLVHIGNKAGVAVRGPGRPDWMGRGILQGILVDLTTVAGAAKHYARYYGEKMLVLTYTR